MIGLIGTAALALFLLCTGVGAAAQVGPQGQDGKAVIWTALKVEQSLSKKWSYATILGYSRRSDFENFDAFTHFGLWCLRQEVTLRINPRLRFSPGAFYSQIGLAGQEPSAPDYMHEVRFYPRLYYDLPVGRAKLAFQFRTDFRVFIPDSRTTERSSLQFRQRLSSQLSVPLEESQKILLSLSAEVLAAQDFSWDDRDGRYEGGFWRFRETRHWVFIRLQVSPKAWLDLGHMTQLRFPMAAAGDRLWSGYLAFGLLVKDPFTREKG